MVNTDKKEVIKKINRFLLKNKNIKIKEIKTALTAHILVYSSLPIASNKV